MFHEFWTRRANEPEYEDELQGFRRAKRTLSREENKCYPCSFFMENDNLVLLIPRILHSSIKYVNFKDMVRWVLEANPDQTIELSDMVLLWDAIIYVIYHFEHPTKQREKAREVCDCNQLSLT